MKKGPLQKRYVYDEMSHPMAVPEEVRTQDGIDEDIQRFRSRAKALNDLEKSTNEKDLRSNKS